VNPSQNRTLNATLAGLDAIARRQEEELRRLCEQPDVFKIAQLLTDRLRNEFGAYLCNFSHAVGHNGTAEDMQAVIGKLEDAIEDEFLKIIGRRYRNDASRQMRWNRDAPRRLLDAIMRADPGAAEGEEGEVQP
jgi:hypothetical protein